MTPTENKAHIWYNRLHDVLSADYLADYNKFLPWRYALGSLCLAAIAAGLCGFYLHARAILFLVGVLAVVVLGLVWPWLCLRGMSGKLCFEQRRGREGETIHARLILNNWFPLGVWGVRVKGGFGVDLDHCLASLAVVPPWRRTEFQWSFVAPCRGIYPAGEVRIVTGFPFGLWEGKRRLTVEGRVLVWPRTFPVGPMPDMAASARGALETMFLNKPGWQGDFLGLRPFQRGDALKRIHWAQTARHDQLVVCERQAAGSPKIQLVLDVDPRSHAGSGTSSSREWAIRIAASLIQSALEQRTDVALIVDNQFVPSNSGTAHGLRLGDGLASIPQETSTSLAMALNHVGCRAFGDGLRIVITTDAALARLGSTRGHLAQTRFIVLRAVVFDHRAPTEEMSGLCVGHWIVCDRADGVPEQLRHGWKEWLCAND